MEGADDTCGVTAAGIVVNYASLFVTCIASYRIALFVAPLSIGPISIPRGTGFMLVGMLAAGLRPRMIKCAGATYPVWGGGTADTVDDVELNVYFPINYVCMCFIAYATGSELIVRRYRKLYKKILKVTLMVILSVFLCVSFPLFLLLDAPTSRDAVFDAGDAKLPAMSAPSLRWAVALLFGSILVSRSPASAISIVGEMRANGDYTQSALGVTICMYVGVNVVFAICQAVSIILLSGQETLTDSLANGTALGDAASTSGSANATGAGDGEGTDAVGVVLIFAAVLLSLFVSIVLGILLGLVLYAFVSLPLRVWGKMALRIRSPLFAIYSKAALCLSLGLLVFVLRDALKWVRVARIVRGKQSDMVARDVNEAKLLPLLGEAQPDHPAGNWPFICMLENDEANLAACSLMRDVYGTKRCIVPQIDPKWKGRFHDVGGLVVDPDALTVNPLEQFLSAAESSTMLLHNDPNADLVRVCVDMASAGTQINNMRLPNDVQVLEVRRANAAVVARGFTKLMIDDELTLCGRPQSLSEVTAIKKGRVVLMLGATDSSFLKSGRLTGRLGSVSARPAQGVPRSSYKYPDQTSVVFRVNVFDAEALHESEQKARDRMSRATHRMSRDSGAGMRDIRATGAD